VVVDDEPDVHELLRAVLEPAGYRVRTSSDGASGLELIRAERPDLVILDLVMPGMSGFEVAHRLRSEPATADIPIIVLTVKQLTDAERERLAGQISALITKDSSCTHRLSDTIRSLLEREGSGGHKPVKRER
jgi:threonine synthase